MKRRVAFALILLATACKPGAAPDGYQDIPEHGKVVQRGTFLEKGCKEPLEDFAGGKLSVCHCRADILTAHFEGKGMAVANDVLELSARKNRCPQGTKVSLDPDVMTDMRQSSFTVTRDDARFLNVLTTHYQYGAGAAHGMSFIESYLIDRKTHQVLTQPVLVDARHYTAAGKAVLEAVKAEVGDNSLLKEYLKEGPIFNARGCRECVVYPEGEDWKVAFQLYSVGPYAGGHATVPIDSKYLSARVR